MKKILAIFLSLFLSIGYAAGVPNSESLGALWRAGQYDEVVEVANSRLAENSEDLPGLLIMYEYALLNYDTESLKRLSAHIVDVGSKTKTEAFMQEFPVLKASFVQVEKVLSTLSGEQLKAESEKAKSVKNRTFGQKRFLVALEKDGLFK